MSQYSREELQELNMEIMRHRVKYRKKEPQKTLLDLCEKLILKEWMYLDDLPHELANTVANIFYSYIELSVLMASVKIGKVSQSAMMSELGLDKIEEDFIMTSAKILPAYQAKLIADYKTMNEMISCIRQIGQEYGRDSSEYESAVAFALATMKHNINPNAIKQKNMQVVNKQFAENPVDEIPNLIDLLNVE